MILMRWIIIVIAKLAILTSHGHASDIDKSKLPPEAVYKAMLEANKQSGWIAFRNYKGKQWIYFTALQTLHCRLEEIRYSVNSDTLDKRFNLIPCNPQLPFSLPDGSGVEEIAIALPSGSASSVSVQVKWDDGKLSEVMTYQPCTNVGEQTCAQVK